VLVTTAMRVMIASNYNPFLLNKDTIDGIPKELVNMTMLPIRTLSTVVKLP
jgi:hypothetical protein